MMKQNAERNERVFDAMLSIAADEALKEEMDALPSREELNKMYSRTKSLDKKVYAVINREFRVVKRKKAMRVFARIAASFCVAVVISASALMSVEASRNFILNFFIDMRGDYVAFDFGLEGHTPTIDNGEISFGYMPEGFALLSSQVLDTLSTYIFVNDAGHQIIIQCFLGRSLLAGIDNEHMDFLEIQLNGEVAHLFEALDGYYSKIMWVVGGYVVAITTTLDTDTLLRIAGGVDFQ